MGAIVTNLVALPILGVVSIPLILSAWVTIWLALMTLFVRFAVVYLEVVYGLIISFFTLPSSSSSFLSFAASEPVTPAAGNSRRNSAHGLVHPRKTNDDSLSSSLWTIDSEEMRKQDIQSYARSMVEAHHLPSSTPYLGLPVSGDERRDFEGVGGWRSYRHSSDTSRPRTAHSTQDKSFHSASTSSTQSLNGDFDAEVEDVDADDLAWLSLNHRLELPSRVVRMGDHSRSASRVHSPHNLDRSNNTSGLNLHAMSCPHAQSARSRHFQSQPGRRRHHHRSQTTSALTTSERRTGDFLSLALSIRPELANRFLSPSTSRVSPFTTSHPFSVTQTRSAARMPSAHGASGSGAFFSSSANAASSSSSGGHVAGVGHGSHGYFTLQQAENGVDQASPISIVSTPSGSGSATPCTAVSNEDRDASSLGHTSLMAHYPTSVRHRRRSIAGPHSRVNTFL